MKKIKNIFIGILIGSILTTATPALANSVKQTIEVVFNSVIVQVNGENKSVDNILYNGTTYLPMRKVAELVGKDIEWNQETMTANIVDTANIEIETIKEVDRLEKTTDEFKVYNIDTDECYAEKNGETYYYYRQVFDSVQNGFFWNVEGVDEDIKITLYKTSGSGINQSLDEILIESVPYVSYEGRLFISKTYYEYTILPLIK